MIAPIVTASIDSARQIGPSAPKRPAAQTDTKLREAFDSFVGETLFAQMLKSMRKTLDKPAYFDGGRTEEIFQQQLDQVLAGKLSAASSEKLSGPMFELFTMQRR
jgi:peptidoglycan hydrolase FlgJ